MFIFFSVFTDRRKKVLFISPWWQKRKHTNSRDKNITHITLNTERTQEKLDLKGLIKKLKEEKLIRPKMYKGIYTW